MHQTKVAKNMADDAPVKTKPKRVAPNKLSPEEKKRRRNARDARLRKHKKELATTSVNIFGQYMRWLDFRSRFGAIDDEQAAEMLLDYFEEGELYKKKNNTLTKKRKPLNSPVKNHPVYTHTTNGAAEQPCFPERRCVNGFTNLDTNQNNEDEEVPSTSQKETKKI